MSKGPPQPTTRPTPAVKEGLTVDQLADRQKAISPVVQTGAEGPALGSPEGGRGESMAEFLKGMGLERLEAGSFALWYRTDGASGGTWLYLESAPIETRNKDARSYGLRLGAGQDEGGTIKLIECGLGDILISDDGKVSTIRVLKAVVFDNSSEEPQMSNSLTEVELVGLLRSRKLAKDPFRGQIPKH